MNSIALTLDAPRAGLADDMERDDNRRGFERDETDNAFRLLVDHLVVDGGDRARTAGRHARRTLAEMDPGYQQQPVLLLTRPLDFRSANSPCPLCDRWNCGGADCPPSAAPTTTESNGQLQCDQCGNWFGFAGWTCPACKQLQGALPMRPTPHERDGRTETPPAPARPHSAVPERHQP